MLKKLITWVRPGVELIRAKFFLPTKQFSKLDFPTFDLPAKEIFGSDDLGY
jgi:hypothetical protein